MLPVASCGGKTNRYSKRSPNFIFQILTRNFSPTSMVSQSVVLMPAPRFSSWAMHELLEPWIHYIPIRRDLSDVEHQVQWMIDHPEESKRISHRAKLWVLDLFYHPDAMEDNRKINAEVLRRYRKHFKRMP
jgi:hypothetical protein